MHQFTNGDEGDALTSAASEVFWLSVSGWAGLAASVSGWPWDVFFAADELMVHNLMKLGELFPFIKSERFLLFTCLERVAASEHIFVVGNLF